MQVVYYFANRNEFRRICFLDQARERASFVGAAPRSYHFHTNKPLAEIVKKPLDADERQNFVQVKLSRTVGWVADMHGFLSHPPRPARSAVAFIGMCMIGTAKAGGVRPDVSDTARISEMPGIQV